MTEIANRHCRTHVYDHCTALCAALCRCGHANGDHDTVGACAACGPRCASYFDVLFDGPPGPESCRFVEVESPAGVGVHLGEWIDRGGGYWALRFPLTSSATDRGRDDMPEPPQREAVVKMWNIKHSCACGHRHGDGIITSTKCPRGGCNCANPRPPSPFTPPAVEQGEGERHTGINAHVCCRHDPQIRCCDNATPPSSPESPADQSGRLALLRGDDLDAAVKYLLARQWRLDNEEQSAVLALICELKHAREPEPESPAARLRREAVRDVMVLLDRLCECGHALWGHEGANIDCDQACRLCECEFYDPAVLAAARKEAENV